MARGEWEERTLAADGGTKSMESYGPSATEFFPTPPKEGFP